MPVEQGVKRIVSQVHRPDNTVECPPVPVELRGRLQEADALQPRQLEAASADAFAIGRIVTQGVDGKPVRTGVGVLEVLSEDVRKARTKTEFATSIRGFASRLMGTGVYKKQPEFYLTQGPEVPGIGPTTDLLVQLDEADTSLTMGASRNMAGSMAATTKLSLHNRLGMAESLHIDLGGSSSSVDLKSLTGMINEAPTDRAAQDAFTRARSLVAPSFHVGFRKPTLLGRLNPVELSFRSECEQYDASIGFTTKVRAVEATVSSTDNKHAVSYGLAWRDVLPLPNSKSLYRTASSPQVVADSVASLKSAVTYSYNHDATRGDRGVPSAGYRLAVNVEGAGVGGDTYHLKAQATALFAGAVFRYAPDTGYMPPLARRAWEAARDNKMTAGEKDAFLGQWSQGLRPHPSSQRVLQPFTDALDAQRAAAEEARRATTASAAAAASRAAGHHAHHTTLVEEASLSPADRASAFLKDEKGIDAPVAGSGAGAAASSPATSTGSAGAASASAAGSAAGGAAGGAGPLTYSVGDRLLSWLSPGITGVVDLHCGALARYGPDAARASGARMCDRLFLSGQRLRGFESVGPRGPPMPQGTTNGDALGGEVVAAATARLILPPPVPSVRVTNAGLRTHLFASVGALAPTLGEAADWRAAADAASMAVGVGVAMPLDAGFSIEANYAVWHRKGKQDVGTTFKLQMMA